MLRISSIIITDKNKKVLLQHRDAHAPTNPNRWGLWGGGIEESETPAQAATRELKEELNIDVSENQLIFLKDLKEIHSNDEKERNIFSLEDKGQFIYKLQEGDDLKFYSYDEIKKLDVVPTARLILDNYFKKSH